VHGERPAWVPLGHAGLELRCPVWIAPVTRADGGPAVGQLRADRRADAGGPAGNQGHPAAEGPFGFPALFLRNRHRALLLPSWV